MAAVMEPATERPLATLEWADAGAVDAAVDRAVRAFPAWRDTSAPARADVLRAIASGVETAAEELAILEARNAGKPIRDARAEIAGVVASFRYYAGAPERLLGQTIPVEGGIDMTFYEPLGVVGLIIPWNFPLAIAAWKTAPALAAGNAVVLKPAELTPLTALRLAEIAAHAGLPEGVLEVVPGIGEVAGRRLVTHPDVAKIGFTGSTTVGREVAVEAGRRLKRFTLELGGKSANIVFADADVDRAAAAAPMSVFANTGQDCCARSRILVEERIAERFAAGFEAATRALRVGNPLDEGTDMGPLISAEQHRRVESFLGDGDAELIFQGDAPTEPGHWFPPTLLRAKDQRGRAVREEIFGPVAVLLTFRSEEEAVALANDTIYGLSGSIWTNDGARAIRMARAVQSGTLSINSHSSVRLQTPFGGFKQSGIGREMGPHALEEYSELKNVFMATR